MTKPPVPYLRALKVLGKKGIVRTFLFDNPQPLNHPRHKLGVPVHFHTTSVANKGRLRTGCCCPVYCKQIDPNSWDVPYVLQKYCGRVVAHLAVKLLSS